jgi:MFS superfamily sulfate permease-like transporter
MAVPPFAGETPEDGGPWRVWLREAGAGSNAGLVAGAQTLTHGVIAFAPLGLGMAETGLAIALASSAAAGLCVTAFAATRPLIGTTTASTALVTGSLLAAARPATMEAGILLAMLLATLAGLHMLAMARLGVARLALHIPAPVMVGVTNAVAALILVGQAPVALGLAPGQPMAADAIQAGSLCVAALAVLLTLRPPPLVPAPVAALAAATLLHHGLAWWGIGTGPVVEVAPMPGHVVAAVRGAAEAWRELADWPGLAARLPVAALSLALVAMAESLTAAAALREVSGRRSDPRKDALGAGAGMLAAGLLGGVPGSVLTSASLACQAWGGMGRISMAVRATVAVLALLVAGPLIATLPFAALAGTLMGTMLRLARVRPLLPGRGPGQARRAADAAVIVAVVATALLFGLIVAILAGVLLSVAIFTVAMAQTTLRRVIANPAGRSRVRRPAGDVRLLQETGGRIVVLELQGAIFFGSAEGILAQVERVRAAGAAIVILDVSRVTRIDMSGGQRLIELCRAAPGQVLIAPVRRGGRAALEFDMLRLRQSLPAASAFPSIAAAVEAAEDILLAGRGGAGGAVLDGPGALAALGLPPGAVDALLPRMVPCSFAPGAAILRQGEAADAAFLLLEGEVEISVASPSDRQEPTRLAVLVPGVLFGEAALLGGGRRTADATARGAVRCLRLTAEGAAALRHDAPDAAWLLLEAVARQLAANLAAANRSIDQLEDEDAATAQHRA